MLRPRWPRHICFVPRDPHLTWSGFALQQRPLCDQTVNVQRPASKSHTHRNTAVMAGW